MPGSTIAQLNISCMCNFVVNHQIPFQSSCTVLHSHQECVYDPLSLHPKQHFSVVANFLFYHSDRYTVLSPCDYNLHHPTG